MCPIHIRQARWSGRKKLPQTPLFFCVLTYTPFSLAYNEIPILSRGCPAALIAPRYPRDCPDLLIQNIFFRWNSWICNCVSVGVFFPARFSFRTYSTTSDGSFPQWVWLYDTGPGKLGDGTTLPWSFAAAFNRPLLFSLPGVFVSLLSSQNFLSSCVAYPRYRANSPRLVDLQHKIHPASPHPFPSPPSHFISSHNRILTATLGSPILFPEDERWYGVSEGGGRRRGREKNCGMGREGVGWDEMRRDETWGMGRGSLFESLNRNGRGKFDKLHDINIWVQRESFKMNVSVMNFVEKAIRFGLSFTLGKEGAQEHVVFTY